LVSVVLPLFNEAAALLRLCEEVTRALDAAGVQGELIFVNDGSTDDSVSLLDRLAQADARVRVVHFSRNFGHQAAVQAGLLHARGDAIVVMDSDLQDDPRCLEEFIRHWEAGYDVVYAVRTDRKENPLKRFLFFAFYRLLRAVSHTPMPNDAGNFGLIDRQVAQNLLRLNEYDRYYAGLRSWVGFRQVGIPVSRGARHDRRPRVSLLGLFRLAKSALFSFSSAPLAIFYGISLASLVVCCGITGFTLYHKLVTGLAIAGWTSTVGIASFFGALNALGIGILGEYVVRIYDQVRGRPPFIVSGRSNFHDGEPLLEQIDSDVRELAALANGQGRAEDGQSRKLEMLETARGG
jgi:dolichol-phosphate mannosyltransferase